MQSGLLSSLTTSLLWPGPQVQQGRSHGSARRCSAMVQARSCRRQREWRAWLKNIEARIKPLPSTSSNISNLRICPTRHHVCVFTGTPNVLKITGTELVARLDAGTPRIVIDGGIGQRPDMMASSVTIMPYMMDAGEDRIIADAIYEGLTKPATTRILLFHLAPQPLCRARGPSRSSIPADRVSRSSRSSRAATNLAVCRMVRSTTQNLRRDSRRPNRASQQHAGSRKHNSLELERGRSGK